jgi:SAM-dependent methyltransferase
MKLSASHLEEFYASRLGEVACYLLLKRVNDLWGDCANQMVLGMGYAHPLLAGISATAKACMAVTPHHGTAGAWSGTDRGVSTCLAEDDRLPFADNTFDRVVLLHAVEEAESPRSVMREAWRVLSPEGRALIVVANRKGLWSLSEATPFGHGRPWTRRQLIAWLNDHLFQVTASTTAAHLPPLDWRFLTHAADGFERFGEVVTPGFGGLVLVEAVKHLYAKPGGGAAAPVTEKAVGRKGVARLPRNEADPTYVETPSISRIDPLPGARDHLDC